MKPSNRRDFPSFFFFAFCRVFGSAIAGLLPIPDIRTRRSEKSCEAVPVAGSVSCDSEEGIASCSPPAALGRSSGPIDCSSLQTVCAVVARVAPLVGGACDSSVFSVRSDGGAWRRFAENENAERFPVRKRPAFRSSFRSRRAINIGPAAFSDSLSPSRCFRCA